MSTKTMMRSYTETLTLNENVFLLLRDLIHEQTGLFYEIGKREILAEKLSPIVIEHGLRSFLDYYYLLKYGTDIETDWRELINALVVQESFFWREMDQIRLLANALLPRLVQSNRAGPLKIWSAACASGEEPITIAMALNEAGWFERAPIEIHGSDASTRAIEKARKGCYSNYSFRALPQPLREKYFEKRDGLWQVTPVLHSRIRWKTANLLARDEMSDLADAPVIFCRNVFIYFSEKAIRKTVRLFWEHMPSPAYLMVGVSESLFKVSSDFELQEIDGVFTYVKDGLT